MSLLSELWSYVAYDCVTAVATILMAVATFCVVRQNNKILKNNKKFHEDNLKPICIFVPNGGIDRFSRENILKCGSIESDNLSRGKYVIHGILKNIGNGPAINVKLIISFPDKGYQKINELSPIGKDEILGSETDPIHVTVEFSDEFNDTDFNSCAGSSWEIFIEYSDIFGNVFRTSHSKNPLKGWTILS
jgi:hypothetical protein